MSEDLNEQRKAFSDKHGAVLLGMHRELKAMQSNIKESKQALVSAQSLYSKVSSMQSTQNAEFNHYKQVIDAKQQESERFHEKCLALLTEQKQREITHQLKVEQLNRTFNKIGLAIFSILFIGIATIWIIKWTH